MRHWVLSSDTHMLCCIYVTSSAKVLPVRPSGNPRRWFNTTLGVSSGPMRATDTFLKPRLPAPSPTPEYTSRPVPALYPPEFCLDPTYATTLIRDFTALITEPHDYASFAQAAARVMTDDYSVQSESYVTLGLPAAQSRQQLVDGFTQIDTASWTIETLSDWLACRVIFRQFRMKLVEDGSWFHGISAWEVSPDNRVVKSIEEFDTIAWNKANAPPAR